MPIYLDRPQEAVASRAAGVPAAAILFLCLFAAQASILVVSPILPQVAAEFGVSTSAAAQMRSVSGITAGIAALILVARGERFRLHRLLGAGLGVIAAGSVGSALAPGFAHLLAMQAVIGLGLALVLSGGLAASEAWAAAGENARLLSWALIGQPVAWVVGQPIVGAVASHDWRWAWLAVPVVASAVALAAVVARDPAIPTGGRPCDPLNLWRLHHVRTWAVGELLAFSAWAGTLVYAGAFFIETYGASVALTGVILGAGAAAYLPGNFLARRLLTAGSAPLLVGSSAGAAVLVALFGAVRTGVTTSALLFALLGFVAAGRTIAGAALGLQLASGHRMAAMSIRTSMQQFGYLTGTIIGGSVLARWGFGGFGWTFAALFAAAALLPLPSLIRARAAASPRSLLRR